VVDLNGLALCSGVGGLEQGIASVFKDYKTVCHVEGETYAVGVLISQMEKGSIHDSPIWSDLRTFKGSKWRGKVDVISSGFPCQPFSKAGKGKGKEDHRYLWPHVSRIIGEVLPSIVILENVPKIIDHSGKNIFGDLAEMGYCSSWGIIRASDAKAPHRRERFFSISIHTNSYSRGLSIYNFKQESYDRIFGKGKLERNKSQRLCKDLPNSNSNRKSIMSFDDKKRRFISKSDPGSKWEVEPRVARVADGVAYWMDRIRACGNGVVPDQAKLAIEILLKQLIDFIEDSKL